MSERQGFERSETQSFPAVAQRPTGAACPVPRISLAHCSSNYNLVFIADLFSPGFQQVLTCPSPASPSLFPSSYTHTAAPISNLDPASSSSEQEPSDCSHVLWPGPVGAVRL